MKDGGKNNRNSLLSSYFGVYSHLTELGQETGTGTETGNFKQ